MSTTLSKMTIRPVLASILAALVLLLVPTALLGSEEDTAPGAPSVPPQIILATQKQPVYPPAAFAARYTGSVLVEMVVLADGKVGDVKVLNCTRPKVGFEEAAVEAVKQWRFEPGRQDDKPVDVVTRLKLNFTRVGVGQAEGVVSAGAFQTALTDAEGGPDTEARGTTSRHRTPTTSTSSGSTRRDR